MHRGVRPLARTTDVGIAALDVIAPIFRGHVEFLLERIQHYMREYHPKHRALIVMDDTSRQLNRAVAMKHAAFQRAGN